jgi:hypothetical protein
MTSASVNDYKMSSNFANLRLQLLRGQPVSAWRDRLVRMWVEEGVITPQEAERRVGEVVCALLDDKDEIIGVTTAYPGRFESHPSPVWFLRMFIRRSARAHQGLAVKGAIQWKALELTFQELQKTAVPSGAIPFAGAVLVTENRKFWSERWLRAFSERGWKPVARDQRGGNIHFRAFDPKVPSHPPGPSST